MELERLQSDAALRAKDGEISQLREQLAAQGNHLHVSIEELAAENE